MSSSPYLILLADDDLNDQEIFKNAIKSAKFKSKVVIVNNGIELMEFLNTKDDLPDVIFLDINMPLKDGITCLKEIRSKNQLKELVIAMFSNTSSQQKIVDSFKNGANVYLSKSHIKEKLHKAIQKIIMYTHLYKTPTFHIDNFMMKID